MITNDLIEIEIVDGGNKIHLKRPGPQQQPSVVTAPMVSPVAPAAGIADTAAAETQQTAPAKTEDEGLVDIPSPIVGTYYAAPSPDSEPYIQLGSEVTPETVVCIIEAMKVMNEIKAGTSGTIAKIMVATGQAVEYGQVLFKVKPD